MFCARREVPFFSIAYEMCDTHVTNPLEVSHPNLNEMCTQSTKKNGPDSPTFFLTMDIGRLYGAHE